MKDKSISNGYITTTTTLNQWSLPIRVDVLEHPDRIDMIYKQVSNIHPHFFSSPEERVFKIVFSCVDGKFHKSEPIYGKIVPASEEHYEFEE